MSEVIVKPGVETTEHGEAKSAKVWGLIAMILGFIMASGAEVLAAVGVSSDSKVGVIGGVVIGVSGMLYRGLVQLEPRNQGEDIRIFSRRSPLRFGRRWWLYPHANVGLCSRGSNACRCWDRFI